ncbi:MAG: sodium-dependent transporter [Gemmatimonadetes bacterium]|uniref:Sodium-dependent transporter n=1 Tax=Candidatus Kutchimonas denitrificans TaxID=3056748 RepID=A0AAE4Z8Y2_9BACT|nr:sodium-dependent transporter [Gemmatimonadota bacterium]NIR74802.1 sodium-dependent transporter [Candidatus Kutchimonas denitrificans]NIR99913.1 sodium-dependent transporter [Gemmatimonadota bacterium]NIT65497.1 sodium-dependent transporter [Gemmatimonadota bacterium]NIU52467.1 sodium-dependent transporter [Gemmatimonadota bacterium]
MVDHDSARPGFTSVFGALMAFIGVAVGLGNVWRFPYMTAAFGGGAFLLVYLALLFLFGIPALTAEFTLGRLTRRGPVGAFTRIGMRGGRTIGWALFVTVLMALSYYSVVVGWVLRYTVVSLTGAVVAVEPNALFDSVLGGYPGQFGFTAAVVALAAAVLLLGIRRGVQRVSAYGMPLLFLLLLALMVRSLTLPGAGEGLRFYLTPDFSKIDAGVVTAALGQLFFSLGLGGTFMVTYASYVGGDVDLRRSAVNVGVGETLASILAGFVIVPAAVTLGVELTSGPPLTFVTAPSIFGAIPGGALFATIFFGLLFFAAFLSDVAGFEVLVAGAVDELGWDRRTAVLTFCVAALALGVVPMLSVDYILQSDLFWGSTMQPLGSALALIGLAWAVGLGRALEEANRGVRGRPVGRLWFYWIKYVVPLGIGLILALGLRDLFNTFVS